MEEERSKLIRELKEREAQVERLRNRYEILMTRLRVNDPDGDSDGEALQAKFIIKAAQEREALMRTGDELDARIQKLLKEEKSMRKSLNLLRAKNVGCVTVLFRIHVGGWC